MTLSRTTDVNLGCASKNELQFVVPKFARAHFYYKGNPLLICSIFKQRSNLELVCMPDQVDVVAGDKESLWVPLFEGQVLTVPTDTVDQEETVTVVGKRNLKVDHIWLGTQISLLFHS